VKYIKTFENIKINNIYKYNINDYVVLDINDDNSIKDFLIGRAKTYDIKSFNAFDPIIVKISSHNNGHKYSYKVSFYNYFNFNVGENEILRLATPNEIEDIKIKKDIDKYNL